MPSDQEIKQAYKRILEKHREDDRAECVTPEAILSLVEGEDEEEARLRTLDHVMACPACQEDFELLRTLARNRPMEKVSRRPAIQFTPQRLALAASLILALGIGSIWWGSQAAGPGPVMRGDGGELELISPARGEVLEAGLTFVWHSVPGAFRYDFELLDSGGDVVFQESTPDTALVVEGFAPDEGSAELSWWVTARTGEGSQVSSPMRSLRPIGR